MSMYPGKTTRNGETARNEETALSLVSRHDSLRETEFADANMDFEQKLEGLSERQLEVPGWVDGRQDGSRDRKRSRHR